MAEEIFDFGFTCVDESELVAIQKVEAEVEKTEQTVVHLQNKLDKLFNSIQPLLNNLKKDPAKEYILWPNRLDKIEQFEDYIQSIYKS
jgi:peptidoglycan hydrolase CwlO-like protein